MCVRQGREGRRSGYDGAEAHLARKVVSLGVVPVVWLGAAGISVAGCPTPERTWSTGGR
jgi:hypothetical protein